jgi:hypothetical protein
MLSLRFTQYLGARGRDDVIWLRRQGFDGEPEIDFGEAKVFDREHYEQRLSDSTSQLPRIRGAEICREIQSQQLPSPRDGLYRIPEDPDDSQGRAWLEEFYAAIHALDDRVCIVAPPERFVEVRVGLELPGVPEVVAQIGKLDQRLAVLLVSLPRFPLWIAHAGLESSLSNSLLLDRH